MHYLKNTNPLASYVDPETRQLIRRGMIAKFESLSKDIKMRIRNKGLLEVSEEEYLAQEASKKGQNVVAPEAPVAPQNEVVEEQPKEEPAVEPAESVTKVKLELPRGKKPKA